MWLGLLLAIETVDISQYSHHIETSQMICNANQLNGFYMMEIFCGFGAFISYNECINPEFFCLIEKQSSGGVLQETCS